LFGLQHGAVDFGFSNLHRELFIFLDLLSLLPQSHASLSLPQGLVSTFRPTNNHGTVGGKMYTCAPLDHADGLHNGPVFCHTGCLWQTRWESIRHNQLPLWEFKNHTAARNPDSAARGVKPRPVGVHHEWYVRRGNKCLIAGGAVVTVPRGLDAIPFIVSPGQMYRPKSP
jgi:hypothetical protein